MLLRIRFVYELSLFALPFAPGKGPHLCGADPQKSKLPASKTSISNKLESV